MKKIRFDSRKRGQGQPPFIIAEMSGNHNHSLKRALEIVEAAAKAGVNALKIQTYTADTMTIDSDKKGFVIKDPKSLWRGKKLYDLYKDASTPWEWHKAIFDRCRKLGIVGFSTPFDETAVDFLEELNVPMYKIASFELVDIPLIKRVAATKKPILMSVGMATIREIKEAIDAARSSGCKKIILLKCTSTYPAKAEDSNILTIPDLKKRFKCEVGLSDHTLGIGVAIASVSLGATMIEKHFTIARADGGVDSAFSMEPDEMAELVRETNHTWQALGKVNYGPTEHEIKSLVFRRSLYAVKDIEKGGAFTEDNLKSIRPGYGLPPKYLDKILGKRTKKSIKRGTPLSWDMVK